MSVINQVLRDLDARQAGQHDESPLWRDEPEAVATRSRRRPALKLGLPVLAVALAALFGQGSWGWHSPGASAAGTVAGSGPSRLHPAANGAGSTPEPVHPAGTLDHAAARVTTVAQLRAFEKIERPANPAIPAETLRLAAAPSATLTDAILSDRAIPPGGGQGGGGTAGSGTVGTGTVSAHAHAPTPTPTPASAPAAGEALAMLASPARAAATPPAAPDKPAGAATANPSATPLTATQIERVSRGPIAAGSADGVYRLAIQRYHAGQLDEAARLLRSALTDEPGHVGARQALAAILIDRHDLARALAVLQEGLNLDPTQASFAAMAARLHTRGGDLEAAVRTLQAAAGERAPAELQAMLADSLSRLRRDREALAHWNSALQRNPSHAGWWLGLALSLEAEGRAQDARTAYERALGLPGLKPEAADYARERLSAAR